MIITGRSPRPGTWRDLAWLAMPFAAAVLVLDAITFGRVMAFEARPPAVVEVTGRVWSQSAAHKRKAQFRIETREGWVDLATGPATFLGSAQPVTGSTPLDNHTPATIAWLDAPGNLFHDPLHYPVRVAQGGQVLLAIDGAAGVAAAERGDLLTEVAVVGVTGVMVPALLLFAAHRRDRSRLTSKRGGG